MERRINKKIQNHFHVFKTELVDFIKKNNDKDPNIIYNFIYDFLYKYNCQPQQS